MTDQPPVDRDDFSQTPSSQQPSTNNASGGVELDARRDVIIGGDVVGRDKVTEVVQGDKVAGDKIVEQQITASGRGVAIGKVNIPIIPLIAGLGIGLAVLILIGFVSTRTQQQLQQILPTPTPARLTGDFNVLVAEFGQDDADGVVKATERSRQLSQTVFDTLKAQREAIPTVTLKEAIDLRYADAAALGLQVVDEATALKAAQAVGAQMVIYGTLDRQGDFIPRFYIAPVTRGEIDVLNTGQFQVGEQPIRFGVDAAFNTNTDLRVRSSALMYLIMGLTYDLFGRVEQSLEVYRQAEEQLQVLPEQGQGKENLYFFLGQAAFYKQFKTNDRQASEALNTEAQAAFQQALNSNPSYSRAMIGLGSVLSARLQRLDTITKTLEMPELGDMFAWYEEAVAQAQADRDPFMENWANFNLAGAYYLQGAAYRFSGDAVKAIQSFEKAIELNALAETYLDANQRVRELAQVDLLQGAIRKQYAETLAAQNDRTGAASQYQESRKYYQACIDQGARAAEDVFLRDGIVQKFCVPGLAAVESALSKP
jgi:tetratricopeptide (TPR) repeat protein